MPAQITISAEELNALLAMREAYATLEREHEETRSMLRLVSAERDLAEERLRAYRRELFGAKSEVRDSEQFGLFNEAEALGANAAPAQEDTSETKVGAHTRKRAATASRLPPVCPARSGGTNFRKPSVSAATTAMRWSSSGWKSANNST
jgi:transposase